MPAGRWYDRLDQLARRPKPQPEGVWSAVWCMGGSALISPWGTIVSVYYAEDAHLAWKDAAMFNGAPSS